MKKLFIPLLVVITLFTASCNSKEEQIKLQKTIYETAVKYRDGDVARMAIYNLLALNNNTGTYKDSLVNFYFAAQMYPQALFLGEELIEEKPGDTILLKILAVSRGAVGLLKESMTDYEMLYEKTQDINHLYELASTQLRLKRYEECGKSLQILFSDAAADSTKVSIRYGQQGSQEQKVPLKAAVLNLNGFLSFELKNYDDARKSFASALQIFPKFELAAGNLDLLDKIEKQAAEEAEKEN